MRVHGLSHGLLLCVNSGTIVGMSLQRYFLFSDRNDE